MQPILATTIVFALPLGVWLSAQRITRRDVVAAIVVTAGLALSLLLADPSGGRQDAPLGGWIVAGAVVIGIATALLLAGLSRVGALRAALLGTASGLLFGLVSAITKAAVEVLQDDGAEVLLNWHLYALIVVGFAGMTITQLSLQTGILRRRSPPARSSTRPRASSSASPSSTSRSTTRPEDGSARWSRCWRCSAGSPPWRSGGAGSLRAGWPIASSSPGSSTSPSRPGTATSSSGTWRTTWSSRARPIPSSTAPGSSSAAGREPAAGDRHRAPGRVGRRGDRHLGAQQAGWGRRPEHRGPDLRRGPGRPDRGLLRLGSVGPAS